MSQLAILSSLLIGFSAQGPAKIVTKVTMNGSAVVGKSLSGEVRVTIPEGFHAYANPASDEYLIPLKLANSSKVFAKFMATYPAGVPMVVAGESKPTLVYEGDVVVSFKVIPAKVGKQTLKLSLQTQLCDDRACQPPQTLEININLVVKKS